MGALKGMLIFLVGVFVGVGVLWIVSPEMYEVSGDRLVGEMDVFRGVSAGGSTVPLGVTDDYVYAEVWSRVPWERRLVLRARRSRVPADALEEIQRYLKRKRADEF